MQYAHPETRENIKWVVISNSIRVAGPTGKDSHANYSASW